MKQRVFVYALIKENEKILLLKPSQSPSKETTGKYTLPGGELAFGQDPVLATKNYIYHATSKEVSAIQLFNVTSLQPAAAPGEQWILIVYLATFFDMPLLKLSSDYGKYKWELPYNLQQSGVSEVAYNLLFKKTAPLKLSNTKSNITKTVEKYTSVKQAIIYCDGGSRGNPGPSASGFIIQDEQERLIEEGGAYLGITTNNQAEYQAVLLALEAATKQGIQKVEFRIDSLLVVNQMNGTYRIKNRDLWPIHQRIKELTKQFAAVTFVHIRREFNREADSMVNRILNEHKGVDL